MYRTCTCTCTCPACRYNYREIIFASECRYIEWVNQRWDYAFFRRIDFNRRVK